MDRLLLVFFLLFMTAACSQRKGVPVNIKIKEVRGLAGLNAEFAGGLVVFGKNATGDSFTRVFDGAAATSDFSVNLNNGIWNIYAIGWEGDNGNFTGKVRCGISNINLSGTNASLNLSLSNASCNSAQFSTYRNFSTDYSFPGINFNTCKILVNPGIITASQENEVCEYPSGSFPATGTEPHVKGHLGSFKILYESMDNSNSLGDQIESYCYSTFDTNAYMANEATVSGGALNLPISGSLPMRMVVRGYYGSTTCDDYESRGYKDFVFGGNLVNSHPDVFTYEYGGGPYNASMYLRTLDVEACSGPRLDPLDYATGDGSQEFPHTICTKDQFNLIADNVGELSKDFRLGADLDFNFTQSTFVPIGGGDTVASAASFKGNFFGNGHKLSNIRFFCDDCDLLGVIRKIALVSPSETSVVNNLTIENINMESKGVSGTTVGALVGLASKGGGGAIKLQNIIARKPRVFANGPSPKTTGGLFGKLSQADVNQAHIVNGNIEGEVSGGIAGIADSGSGSITLSKVSYLGETWAWANNPGGAGAGIVGQADGSGSVMISEARSEGKIRGNGQQGGIVGNSLATTLNISNSYSVARVLGDACPGCANDIGGLIGSAASAAPSVSNSFKTLGRVIDFESGPALGIYGGASFMPSCTNAYHTGPATHGCASGGSLKTVAQIQTNSHLTGLSIGTTTGAIWMKPSADDTYDFPRLSWEEIRSAELPELARDCSGQWSLPGSGTQASPYIISNASQLASLASNNYYKLCRDIDFDLAGQNAPLTYPPNVVLDGNNHGIHNFVITPITGTSCNTYGNVIGLFNTITAGSTVKNLDLNDFQYILTNTDTNLYAAATSCSGGYKIGTLAGINSGTIQDVIIDQYVFKFNPQFNTTYSGNTFDYVGGIVADNLGTISGVDVYGRNDFRPNVNSNLTGTNIYNFGGAVGKVYSGALVENIYADIEFHLNRTVAAEEPYDSMNIGGIAATNLGTISKSALNARVQHNNSVTPNISIPTAVFGGIVSKLDGGTISDTNASMILNVMAASYYFTDMIFGGLVGYSNGGTIQRSIVAPNRHSSMGNDFKKADTSIVAKALIASAHASNATTLANSFCIENYETNPDFLTNVGLTFADDTYGEPENQAYPVSGTAITLTNAPNTCLVKDSVNSIYPVFTNLGSGAMTIADDTLLSMNGTKITGQTINLTSMTDDWSQSSSFNWIFQEDTTVGVDQSNDPPTLSVEYYDD